MSSTQRIIKIFAYLLAVSIIIGICSCIFHLVNYFIPTTEKVVVEDYYKEFQDVTELELDINAADLRIEEGNKFSVKAENLVSKIKVKEEDGLLKIKQNKVRVINRSAGSIVITIPSELDRFTFDGGAGTVDIEDLKAKKAKISLGFGNVKISNIDFGSTKISGGAGKIEIEKALIKDLQLSAGAGNVKINSELKGDSEIDCGAGEVDIILLGGEDNYKIRAEKGLGNLTINNKNYGDEITYGNGKNLVKVEGGMGNINIRFQK